MQFETSLSSGGKTASGVVSDKPCFLVGAMVDGAGGAAPTLILYDNATAASGKIVYKYVGIPGSTPVTSYAARDWQRPVECVNGLYATVSGANATYIVEYMRK